jgi:hypothetical protein
MLCDYVTLCEVQIAYSITTDSDMYVTNFLLIRDTKVTVIILVSLASNCYKCQDKRK